MAQTVSGATAGYVLAVPSTKRRNRERGFDPAVRLAQRIAWRLGLPRKQWLLRPRDTSAQSSLHQSERFTNISGAFRASHRVSRKDVLLVDDIMTTGATLSEATSTLLRAGARSVSVCILARTPELDTKKGLKPS